MFRKGQYLRELGLFIAKLIARIIFVGKGGSRNAFGSYISPKEIEVRNNPEPRNEILNLLTKFVPHKTNNKLIRVGSEFDGGYVMLPMNWPNTYLLSGGISTNNEFEIELAEMGASGLEVDYSIVSPPRNHPNLEFMKRKITSFLDVSTDKITLDNLFEKALYSVSKGTKFILKLDIEGHEWACFEGATCLPEFDQIIVEYHNLHKLAEENFRKLVYEVTEKIQISHSPVYLSANNCCGVSVLSGLPIPNVIEVTYAKKNSYKIEEKFSLGELTPKNHGNYIDRAVLSIAVFWEGLIK